MRIKRSQQQDDLLEKLTHLFNFKTDGTTARIAYTISLNSGIKFDGTESIASDGKEFRDVKAIFGTSQSGKSYYQIYKSLLDQHYRKETSEEEFATLFKLHFDHGLKKIENEIAGMEITSGEHVSYLADNIKESLKVIKRSDAPSTSFVEEKIEYPEYKGLVEFNLGETESGEKINIKLNDLNEFDSHHIAIAGMTGSGKTQLMKDILFQISENTNNELKYIFFDYKGEGDRTELDKFLKTTGGKFIDLLNDDFNFNPLEYISLTNKREQPFQIQSFIDSIQAIEPKIGVKQTHNLKNIITDLFTSKKHPELKDIMSSLENYYEINNISADSLLSTVDKLSSGLFNKNSQESNPIYQESLYLNLPITIADTIRQLCVFLILKYLLAEFSKSNDTRPEDSSEIKPLRYVIVIDEAHVYLKNKNARKILEDLLRVIRSKGVVIILLTQGVDDFKKKDFDFSSQIKIPICLNIKDKNISSLTNFLGTATSKRKFEKAIAELENGKGLVNFKDPQLFDINQFYKR